MGSAISCAVHPAVSKALKATTTNPSRPTRSNWPGYSLRVETRIPPLSYWPMTLLGDEGCSMATRLWDSKVHALYELPTPCSLLEPIDMTRKAGHTTIAFELDVKSGTWTEKARWLRPRMDRPS